MNKILHISDAYLKLPDDFSGNLSDALFLFYQIRAKTEQLNEISEKRNFTFEDFKKENNKNYSISFEFLDE